MTAIQSNSTQTTTTERSHALHTTIAKTCSGHAARIAEVRAIIKRGLDTARAALEDDPESLAFLDALPA